MRVLPEVALTYDDVLLVPQYSDVESRKGLSTCTHLTLSIALQIPIVSANMDTVTESEMAISMAREGGIGIIHRFMSVDEQVRQVTRVKKTESFVVTDPIVLTVSHTVGDIRRIVDETGTGGILVVDDEARLVGIVTTRDLVTEDDDLKPIGRVMHGDVITGAPDTTSEQAAALLHLHRIEKLPLVDRQGHVVGLITQKDLMKTAQYPKASKDAKGRLAVGAAVGVKEKELRRVERLLEAGADCIVVDIAHGDSKLEIDMIKQIRRQFSEAQIVGGNVATADGSKGLIDAGVDAIKVGVGPGSICVTRMVAGAGVPQLTAVMMCAEVARAASIPLIADGGIRNPGDVAKALAAGASAVMIGSMLAGTDESPGLMMTRNGHRYKTSRGMASVQANAVRKTREGDGDITQEEIDEYVSEGVEAAVPYRGRAKEVLTQLVGGLQSGMSYCGAHTIAELFDKAVFARMTPLGMRESMPHDVQVL